MTRIGEGDLSARDPFLKTIQPFVDRSATRIAGQVYGEHMDTERVKEIVQEVLIKNIMDASNFDGSEAGWNNFSRCMQLDLRQQFTKDKKRQEEEHAAISTLPADSPDTRTHDPYAHRARAELKQAMDEALALLPPQQREVINLRFVDGYTGEETAETLGLKRSQVRALEKAAIIRLDSAKFPHSERLRGLLKDDDNIPTPVSDDLVRRRFPPPPEKDLSWREGTGNAAFYRDEIRHIFAKIDKPYDDEHLKAVTGLSDQQWNALMLSDLRHDKAAREILRNDEHEITKKLFDAHATLPFHVSSYDASHNKLTRMVTGIMAIAQNDRSSQRG